MPRGTYRLIALSTVLILAIAALVFTRARESGAAVPPPDTEFRMTTVQQHAPSVTTRPAVPRVEYQRPYVFTTDWFSHDVPLWESALADYRGRHGISYLEIGLYEGRSALWILENILTHPTARLTGIDPFGDPDDDELAAHGRTFFANLEISGMAEKATIIRGYSQLAMRTMPVKSFDIVYIDGSHTAADALEDLILARRLLKDDGVLIIDDYLWELNRDPIDRPKVAVDWFYTLFQDEFDVIDGSYQAVLKKKSKPVT